jgi:hypothetical protein
MLPPDPDDPADRSASSPVTLQAYVVPVGITPAGVYEKPTALHDAVLCGAIVATGFTVTVTLKAAPVQLPDGDVGVTL